MILKGIVSRRAAAAAVGGGAVPLPAGIPTPLVWFTPDSVELNGSSQVTKILNLGTGGDTYDATPNTANLATISAEAAWGGRNVFIIPTSSTGGYGFATMVSNTAAGIATYKTGVETSFGGYEAIWSGSSSSSNDENELVGQQGQPKFFNNFGALYYDGLARTATHPVLPMFKKSLASTPPTVGEKGGTIWADNFGGGRRWSGQSGEFMFWTETLTPTQIEDVLGNIDAYYA